MIDVPWWYEPLIAGVFGAACLIGTLWHLPQMLRRARNDRRRWPLALAGAIVLIALMLGAAVRVALAALGR